MSEVIPVMTNNYEENILKGVRDSSYSLESSIELLQKDVVQLHAPRYQSMRRVKLLFILSSLGLDFEHVYIVLQICVPVLHFYVPESSVRLAFRILVLI